MKPSNSALALTLGRVTRLLDLAYPPNPFQKRGANGSPWWWWLGVVLCFKNSKKALFLRRNSAAQYVLIPARTQIGVKLLRFHPYDYD
jgi:hypothetical protein